MTAREKSILFALCVTHGLVHAYMLVFPTIYDRLGDSLGLEFAGVGAVGMVSYLAFGFGSFPAGFLTDRLGAGLVLVVCLVGTSLASVLAIFAASPVMLVLALVLLGLFASLYHPAGLAMLTTSIRQVGKALGIHGTAGTMGVACAPVVAGFVTARYGWNYSYLGFGVVGAVVAVFLMFRLGFHRGAHRPERSPESEGSRFAGIGRKLITIYIIGAVYGLIYRGLLTFFPTYLSERIDFIGPDVGRLGVLSSAILVFSMIGPLLGGHLASRRETIERNLLLVFIALGVLAVGFYFLQGTALILVAAPAVLLIFGFQPLQNALIAACSHRSRRGMVFGVNYTVSFGIGALASGIGGVVGERFGLRSIFVLMLGLCVIEVMLILLSKRSGERVKDHGLSES
jgi:MFS family permease